MKFAWHLRWHLLGSKTRVSSVDVLLLLVLFAVSTAGFWHLENDEDLSLVDSFWPSYVPMTMVGYGNIAPQSLAVRLFAMLVTMSCGIGIMAYMITLPAAAVVEREAKRVKGLQKVKFSGHIS